MARMLARAAAPPRSAAPDRSSSSLPPLLPARAVLVGIAGGLVLYGLLHPRVTGRRASLLAVAVRRIAPLTLAAATFFAAERVGAEPLLACVAAGLLVAK